MWILAGVVASQSDGQHAAQLCRRRAVSEEKRERGRKEAAASICLLLELRVQYVETRPCPCLRPGRV